MEPRIADQAPPKDRADMSTPRDDAAGPDSVYRAYHMSDQGRIEFATVLQASSDEEAIEQARQLVDGHAVEVWDRGRFIQSLSPER